MNKSVERLINQIYNEVFKKIFTQKRMSSLAAGSKKSIKKAIRILKKSKEYNEFAKEFAKELAKKGLRGQTGEWKKFYEAAKARHYIALPATYKEFQFQQLSKAVKHNFKMIKSIPATMLTVLNHKYTSTLIEEVAKGNLSRGSFAKMLASHGHKHAKLIARTETAKLQTAITKNRAIDVGSVAYIWLSSNDKRTRKSHKDMNGVVVFWRQDSEKPLLDNMRGDAGEFPNCRCDAQPIVDIDDLTKSNYKVYDYRNDTIINMDRRSLVLAIQNAKLS